ncbi:MAG: glycosyltransferase family 2 protein [Armatimonadetes bacterium]|nr:glycosyltransferase family 2 protein [Armatimonadota bacterium]
MNVANDSDVLEEPAPSVRAVEWEGSSRDQTADLSVGAKVYLSIIIPAFNEENHILGSLQTIHQYMGRRDFTFEVIVVDDGSRDGTQTVVEEFGRSHGGVRLVQNGQNRGKGYSVRHGVRVATGRDILFSDADLSTPVGECERLLPFISSGEFDVAIGSRALPESRLEIRQPFYREWMGRMFNKVVQKVAVPGIVDTQCGFKAFRGAVARRVFRMQKLDGFAFDVEILYLARKLGYTIREVPVTWRNSPDSRVNASRDSMKMLRELFLIRLNDLRGLYEYPIERQGISENV